MAPEGSWGFGLWAGDSGCLAASGSFLSWLVVVGVWWGRRGDRGATLPAGDAKTLQCATEATKLSLLFEQLVAVVDDGDRLGQDQCFVVLAVRRAFFVLIAFHGLVPFK